MAQIQAYLGFAGQCREAMAFYQQCLGGELDVQTVGESAVSGEMAPETHARVMHASLTSGDLVLLGSDMGGRLEPGQTVSLMVQCDSREQTEAYFGKLSAGGTVTQPLTASFWGSTFGHLTDRYGIQWMLNGPQ